MLPVDPDGIEAEWCDESCGGNRAHRKVQAKKRWDLALVGVTYRFTGMVGLE